jgi:hypothetical protein
MWGEGKLVIGESATDAKRHAALCAENEIYVLLTSHTFKYYSRISVLYKIVAYLRQEKNIFFFWYIILKYKQYGGLQSKGLILINLNRQGYMSHNEQFHNLCSSPNIIRHIKLRRFRWAGHVARMGKERKVYKVLVEKFEGKRPLGRARRRWKDGIRIYLREIGCGVQWIQLAHDMDRRRALVNTVMNFPVLAPQT